MRIGKRCDQVAKHVRGATVVLVRVRAALFVLSCSQRDFARTLRVAQIRNVKTVCHLSGGYLPAEGRREHCHQQECKQCSGDVT